MGWTTGIRRAFSDSNYGSWYPKMSGAFAAAKAQNEQELLAKQAGEQEAARLGKVRTGYGVLSSGLSDAGRAVAHERRATLGSAIGSNAEALRDTSVAGLTDQATDARNAIDVSASRAGQFGGSIDQANRRNLLATFAVGRGNIATGVQQQREGAAQAVDNERLQMEGAVRANGQQGLEQMYAAGQGLSAINSARANIPLATFGNMLGSVGTGLAGMAGAGALTGIPSLVPKPKENVKTPATGGPKAPGTVQSQGAAG